MQSFIGTSLKTRLYLLVLTAFIPVALLIFYIAEEQKELETSAILQRTVVLARAAANEENQQLESTRNLLAAVADAYLLADSGAKKLSAFMTSLLDQSKGYAGLGIVDPDGRPVAGSDPAAIGRDARDKAWFANSLQSKDLTMGPYVGDHIAGKPVLYFALPALDSRQQIKAVAYAALDLNWMNRTVFKQLAELPRGSRLTLLDEDQGMLSYDVDSGQ